MPIDPAVMLALAEPDWPVRTGARMCGSIRSAMFAVDFPQPYS